MTTKPPPVSFFGPEPVAARRLRAIVAEDDPDMRRLIADALGKDGFEVSEVSDGARLLMEVVALAPKSLDLVIADVRMPVSSGLQVLRGLRRAGVSTPFVIVTAFGDDATRREAERLGATYVEKPFALEVLRTTVHTCLARHEHEPLPTPP